jgi:transposase
MVEREVEARILRLYHVEKWPIGTIAREISVHHGVVRRVLAQNGVAPGRLYQVRPSILDSFRGFIAETLEKFPRLCASRLYEMVRQRGYPGGPDHFRHVVGHLRPPRTSEAYLHLRTLAGEQAQVDWAHFGTVPIGRAVRRLSAFLMVLTWSRMLFVRFYLSQRLENFLRGHVEAFSFFAGAPRICLYDNLKSVVLERIDDAIRFHPTLLAFAGHYRYEPRPAAPYRPNEKGGVESAVRYLRRAFYAARPWSTLDDLNAQVLAWCSGPAADRPCPGDPSLSVREAFAREQSQLLALPETPFPTDEREEVRVGKFPYIRFDLNDYSVPHELARQTVTVLATLEAVRILHGTAEVARHPRCFDKGQRLEDPAHIAGLVEAKRRARQHRGIDRLRHAVPRSAELLEQLARNGHNLGAATAALLRLLDLYGSEELDQATAEALANDAPHPHSVRHILERRRRASGQLPPVAVALPPEIRAKDWAVPTHDLDSYDRLGGPHGQPEPGPTETANPATEQDHDDDKGLDDEPR